MRDFGLMTGYGTQRFTLQKIKKDFGLQVDEQPNLFGTVEPIAGSDLLNSILQETVPLAIAINTEKALQQFNQREGQAIAAIYGAVTTGEIWKFLKLVNTTVSIDLTDYYISPNLNNVLGILIQGLGLQ